VQAPRAHTPLLQPAVAFGKAHTVEQVLQWLGSDVRLISQPSPIEALQFANPVLQAVIEQLPPAQAAVAFAGAQAWPHVPQFCMLVPRLTSQPFETSVSQLPKPAVHAIEHTLLAHEAVPLVELHILLQAPQLAPSFVRRASQPLEYLVSQSANPELQAATVQAELRQAAVPFGATQVVPQVPQLAASLVVVASQPLPTLPSQFPKPAAQAIVQTPAEHPGVP